MASQPRRRHCCLTTFEAHSSSAILDVCTGTNLHIHIRVTAFVYSNPVSEKSSFSLYFQWVFKIRTYYFFNKYSYKARRNEEIDGGGKNWAGGGFLFGAMANDSPLSGPLLAM